MAEASSSFHLLHSKVQRWVWQQGWEELRDIQERSIPILVRGEVDAIIAAATASGKTEAAFLPILSRLARLYEQGHTGLGALYISPLRALINDQFRRVEGLCDDLDIPVYKWHGDVTASAKNQARRAKRGIVLITPESIEAMLVRRGREVRSLFSGLSYIVIDELHAFLDQPRGKQLQSLLHRIERLANRSLARIGLSATLADLSAAAAFLRPADAGRVKVLESRGGQLKLLLQLRGYVDSVASSDQQAAGPTSAQIAVADHLFETLRGRKNLLFAGSRRNVELYTAALATRCERERVPSEFHAHHGSLSREWREDAEASMRDASQPSTVVCTTTLELGIDVGSIESVAQIGPGHTVAGMRQRLGRSGRRPGQSAVMRVYVLENALDGRSHVLDTLRPETLLTVAMLELLLERWMEPPRSGALHLSTLMHQILALICQIGGVTASRAYSELIQSKVFAEVPVELFQRLLRRMGETNLIEQAADRTLLLGAEGERLANGYEFFAVFETPEEYRVVHVGKPLGTLPVEHAPDPEDLIIFAGRWWLVLSVEPKSRQIVVQPARGGKPPRFGGERAPLDDSVVARIRRLYGSSVEPRFLDPIASDLLRQGRASFARLGLAHNAILESGGGLLIFPWVGGRRQMALTLALRREGVHGDPVGLAIVVPDVSVSVLRAALQRIAQRTDPDPVHLAAPVEDKLLDKYDGYLSGDLLNLNYASRMLETKGLSALAGKLSAR